MDIDVVGTPPRRRLDRQYVVFDNDRLAAALDVAPRIEAAGDRGPPSRRGTSGSPASESWATVTAGDDRVRARLVVDATGAEAPTVDAPSGTRRRVVPERIRIGARPTAGRRRRRGDPDGLASARRSNRRREPSFLHVLSLGDGRWLVEETSLARQQPMPALELRGRLALRLGRDLTDEAEHVEHVLDPTVAGRACA